MRHDVIAQRFEPKMLKTHNGTITVYTPENGLSVTLRIKTQSKNVNFAPGERLLAVHCGPDDNDFEPFAFVKPNGYIAVWGNKKGDGDNWTKYQYIADMLMRASTTPDLECMIIGACRKCNMPLRSPESIMAGIGPECSKKQHIEQYNEALIPY